MSETQDYFLCEKCSSKDFKLVFNFSLRFHRVNFSDDLIYDRLTEEFYICTTCDMVYSKKQIERGLNDIKKRRKEKG